MDGFHPAARPPKQLEAFIGMLEHMVDLLFRCTRVRQSKELTDKEPGRTEAICHRLYNPREAR